MDDIEARIREEYRSSRQDYSWSTLRILTVAVAVVWPALYLLNLRHPWPGSTPLAQRLIFAGCALVVTAALWLVPRWRVRSTLWCTLFGIPLLCTGAISIVDSNFNAIAVERHMLAVYALALAVVSFRQVAALYIPSVVTLIAYGMARSDLSTADAYGAITTLVIAYVLAAVIAVFNAESRRREIQTRWRAQLEQELQVGVLRSRDQLTGLPNVDRFHDLCEDAVQAASLRSTRFAIAEIDPDHFSRVVEQHGHHASDGVLREIAKRFAESVPEAILCRGRSDTFLVILQGIESRRACELLGLRRSVAAGRQRSHDYARDHLARAKSRLRRACGGSRDRGANGVVAQGRLRRAARLRHRATDEFAGIARMADRRKQRPRSALRTDRRDAPRKGTTQT